MLCYAGAVVIKKKSNEITVIIDKSFSCYHYKKYNECLSNLKKVKNFMLEIYSTTSLKFL